MREAGCLLGLTASINVQETPGTYENQTFLQRLRDKIPLRYLLLAGTRESLHSNFKSLSPLFCMQIASESKHYCPFDPHSPEKTGPGWVNSWHGRHHYFIAMFVCPNLRKWSLRKDCIIKLSILKKETIECKKLTRLRDIFFLRKE